MNPNRLANQAEAPAARAPRLPPGARQARCRRCVPRRGAAAADPFLFLLTIFLLACFVGYYVVWNVTPALHSPADGRDQRHLLGDRGRRHPGGRPGRDWRARIFGFLAVTLASVNIFGGFLVTRRMLAMFQPRRRR